MTTEDGTSASRERGRGRPKKGVPLDGDALLEAATICFAQQGFDRTSLRVIAQMAGVDVAMISYRHGSKLGLWNEVVSSVAAESVERIEEFIRQASTMSEPEGTRHLLSKIVEMVMDRPHFAQMLIGEIMTGNDGDRRGQIIALLAEPIHHQLLAFARGREEPGTERGVDPGLLLFSAISMAGLIASSGDILGHFTELADRRDSVTAEMQKIVFRMFGVS
jgi:AcrR family transcriptional regulator